MSRETLARKATQEFHRAIGGWIGDSWKVGTDTVLDSALKRIAFLEEAITTHIDGLVRCERCGVFFKKWSGKGFATHCVHCIPYAHGLKEWKEPTMSVLAGWITKHGLDRSDNPSVRETVDYLREWAGEGDLDEWIRRRRSA